MRTSLAELAAAVALAILSLAPPAGAQPVIDDFETGTFHLVGGSTTTSVSSPGHAMAAFREVGLNSIGGLLPTADLDAWTTADDKLRITFGPTGGSAYLLYVPSSPVDLTAAGQNDRIEVSFAAATTGGFMNIMVWDGISGNDAWGVPTSGGIHVFPLVALSGVDLTHVTRLLVDVSHPSWSAYDLRDIRAMRTNALPQRFDVPTETVVGPPYPLSPLPFLVTDTMPSDMHAITLLGAMKIASGGAARIALTGMDSGGDTEAGHAGLVGARWNDPFQGFQSTAFELQVDISALSGIQPQPFLPALPAITTTPTGFLLEFEVRFLSSEGQLVRTSRRQMPFDAYAGQALQLTDVVVRPAEFAPADFQLAGPGPAGSPVGFEVSFNAMAVGSVDPGEPLFEAMLTGDCRPETITATSGPEAPTVGQALRAQPAVSGAGVDILLAHPAEAAGRIDLFDVTGRFLQSLEVPQGGIGRFWDGRNSDGRATAAGVYFARFTDGDRDLRARIVRVR